MLSVFALLSWRNRRLWALLANTSFALSSFLLGWLLLVSGDSKSYGAFAFYLLFQSFGYGLINALFGAPLLIASRDGEVSPNILKSMISILAWLSFMQAAIQGLILWQQNLDLLIICMLIACSLVLNLRWFIRCIDQNNLPLMVITLDLCYSAIVFIGLAWVFWQGCIELVSLASLIMIAALVVLIPATKRLCVILKANSDWQTWREGFDKQGKHALSGVVTAEITANSLQYLLMIILGAAALAPLAAAGLFLRPMTLVQASLAQIDRPHFAKAAIRNDIPLLKTKFSHFAVLNMLACVLNILALVLFYYLFPQWLWPDTDSLEMFKLCLVYAGMVSVLRSLRSPASILLQAYDQFDYLAKVTFRSSVITVPLVLAALLLLGLEGALFMMLIGEMFIALPIINRCRHILFGNPKNT